MSKLYFIPIYIELKKIDLEPLYTFLSSFKSSKNILLLYILQYKLFYQYIKRKLTKKGYNIIEVKFIGSKYKNQILGCTDYSILKNFENDIDLVLILGEGNFHALQIYRLLKKDIYLYNPLSGNIKKISKSYLETYESFIRISYINFLTSKNIGIITSTKYGQNLNKISEKLAKLIKQKYNKEPFLFIANNIKIQELENFSYIDFWIINACPRIIDDLINNNYKHAVTIQEFINFLK